MTTKVVYDSNGDYIIENAIDQSSEVKPPKSTGRKSREKSTSETKSNSQQQVKSQTKRGRKKTTDSEKDSSEQGLNKMLESPNQKEESIQVDDTSKSSVEVETEAKCTKEVETEAKSIKEVEPNLDTKLTKIVQNNIDILSISDFIQKNHVDTEWFISNLSCNMHIFLCSPATAHHVGNDIIIYGVVQLEGNTVILHCVSLSNKVHTIFIFDTVKLSVSDVEYAITSSGILKAKNRMLCSLYVRPNGI